MLVRKKNPVYGGEEAIAILREFEEGKEKRASVHFDNEKEGIQGGVVGGIVTSESGERSRSTL